MSRYHSTYHGAEQATSVVVSPDSTRVFVTGFSEGPNRTDYATAAYAAATGAPLWLMRYDGPGSGLDQAYSAAVAPDGSKVYVTGYSAGSDGFLDFATVAYDASDGAESWVSRSSGPSGTADLADFVAVSPDGSTVYVTGNRGSVETNSDYLTAAYDAATGTELWTSLYDGPVSSYDEAASLAIGPDGSQVYVTGFSVGSHSGYDYVTLALDGITGATVWGRRYNGPAGGTDAATSVAVSANGAAVVVTGLSRGVGTNFDYATVAYGAATGARRWVSRYTGPGTNRDHGEAVAVSPDGSRVFVTGRSESSPNDWDYATVSYDAGSGAEVWVTRYAGPGGARDESFALGVSPDGSRVYVTGNSDGGSTSSDYATVAYDAASGGGIWLGRWNSSGHNQDAASALAVSPDGTMVFVTGYTARGFSSDYATLAYAA